MGSGKTAKRYSYERGAIAHEYLRREYARYLSSREQAVPGTADKLLDAYFDYHVTRLINLYIVSGSVDKTSLTTLLTTIVRIAFKIFLSKDKEEVRATGEIKGRAVVRHRTPSTSESPSARVGVGGSCEPGASLILGASAAEAVSRLDITLTTSINQHLLLRGHPRVFERIMEAFDRAVPLNLDYRIILAVREEDRTFKLPPARAKTASAAASAPLLGITSALGLG